MKPLNVILLALGVTAVIMCVVVVAAVATLKSTIITLSFDGPAPSEAQVNDACRVLDERIKAFGQAANVRSGKVERRASDIVVTLRGYTDLSGFQTELLRKNQVEFYLAADEEPATVKTAPAEKTAAGDTSIGKTAPANTAIEKALAAIAAGETAPALKPAHNAAPAPDGFQRRVIVHEYLKLGTMDVVQKSEEPILVRESPEMAIAHLKSAKFDRPGRDRLPVITIEFDPADATRFAEITEANKGRRLALVIDGEVFTAPKIQGAITGGVVQIQNIVSSNQAFRLYHLLRIGALPVPLKIARIQSPGAESKMIIAK